MKVFNRYSNKVITIEEWEKLCPKCRGSGVNIAKRLGKFQIIQLQCSKCLGKGKMDWIEIAMGAKNV